MKLRRATLDDAKMLFDWRNDPQTRANSISTGEVDWQGHVGWLDRSLSNPNRTIFIALNNEFPVGTIRFDSDPSKSEVELSWTVAPEARGKGYGQAMVQVGTKLPALKGQKILARIKPNNLPSIRIAEKAGFRKSTVDSNEITEWLLEK